MSSLSLIFRASSASRYSLAALLGAVEVDSRLSGIRVEAPLENFSDSIRRHSQQGLTVVAFSVMSTQTKQVREEVSQILADTDGNVILIGGGPHASVRPRDLLEWGFNYVVVGEGEHVLPEILWRIETGADPESILGVVTQESEEIPKPSMLCKFCDFRDRCEDGTEYLEAMDVRVGSKQIESSIFDLDAI